MAGGAGAQRRHTGEVLRGCLTVAHRALDTICAMGASLPLVIDHLVAGSTGVPGWNQAMVNNCGLILLCRGRPDGDCQNEKSEQRETKDARGKTFHKQTSFVRFPSIEPAMFVISDIRHVLPESARRADFKAFRQAKAKESWSVPLGCCDHGLMAEWAVSLVEGTAGGRPAVSVACKPTAGNSERKRPGQIV